LFPWGAPPNLEQLARACVGITQALDLKQCGHVKEVTAEPPLDRQDVSHRRQDLEILCRELLDEGAARPLINSSVISAKTEEDLDAPRREIGAGYASRAPDSPTNVS
jgi:hypothetical protein